MYTGFILKVGETSDIAKANLARKNFGYEDEDVIVILKNGKPMQIETLEGAWNNLGSEPETLEETMAALLEKLNNPPAQAEPNPAPQPSK